MPAIRSEFDGRLYFEGDDFKSWDLARDIVEKYPIATTIKTDRIYVQQGSVWDRYGEQMIRSELWHILGNATSQTKVNETIEAIKHLSRMPREEMLGLPQHKIVVENGIVDLLAENEEDRFSLEKNGPEYGTFTRIPVQYDPRDVVAEAFNDFLFDVLHRDDVSIMWELIGYCLYRGYPFQKAFMMVGDGANGKSTLLKVVRNLLGDENVSSMELKTLAENQFAVAALDGKLANIAPDISGKDLKETSTFKALTGEDRVKAERKYESPYDFYNYATLIFSANQPPKADDNTYAYERRWLYFEFPNTFNADDENTVSQKELMERFEQEYPAILNQAIRAFQRLWNRGGFEDTVYMKQFDGAHDRITDPTVAFVEDKMFEADGEYVRKKEAYTAFRRWCADNGYPTQGERHFESVLNNIYYPEVGKDPDDKRRSVYMDIGLETEQSNTSDQDDQDEPDRDGSSLGDY